MKVVWTKHAEDRQREWEKKLDVTKQKVEYLLLNPEQIVPGDMGVLVAQSRYHDGLLRAPFVEAGGDRKVLTVYWTNKVDRYWKGEQS